MQGVVTQGGVSSVIAREAACSCLHYFFYCSANLFYIKCELFLISLIYHPFKALQRMLSGDLFFFIHLELQAIFDCKTVSLPVEVGWRRV